MTDPIFEDWRYRWSLLVRNWDDDGWAVIVEPGHAWFDGEQVQYEVPVLRRFRYWSPRDWIRFPLHRAWARRHFGSPYRDG